jgi:hypothetical protein
MRNAECGVRSAECGIRHEEELAEYRGLFCLAKTGSTVFGTTVPFKNVSTAGENSDAYPLAWTFPTSVE